MTVAENPIVQTADVQALRLIAPVTENAAARQVVKTECGLAREAIRFVQMENANAPAVKGPTNANRAMIVSIPTATFLGNALKFTRPAPTDANPAKIAVMVFLRIMNVWAQLAQP